MNTKSKNITAVILIVICISLWFYVVINVSALKNNKPLSLRYYINNYHRREVSVADISSWMTFDYINKVFKLPPAYLKQALQINDAKYPVLTIGQYAKKTKNNISLLITNTQSAVKTYLASETLKK
jgi:hypothetical protein